MTHAVFAAAAAAMLLAAMPADAQWLKTNTPGIPRTKDGKPNLTAPAPKAENVVSDALGAPVIFRKDASGAVTGFVIHTVEGDQEFERKK
jgi:hypothetical protein